MKILIVGGANIAAVGRREPAIYGCKSYAEIKRELAAFAAKRAQLEFFESEREGELIERLSACDCDGLIYNLGGFSHTSVALADTLKTVCVPKIEVHFTNIAARDPFRQPLITGSSADGIICGFEADGYKLAIIKLTEEL